MTDYIISEEKMNALRLELGADIIADISSHPLSEVITEEKCKYWGYKDGKPVCSLLMPEPDLYIELTNAIRKDERKNVINEAKWAIKVVGMPFGTEAVFIQTLNSLRNAGRELGEVEQ
jgi:hypothetical protein